MERQTVDFGIDLGTTNSVVARTGKRGVQVIRNRYQQETTPSAVAGTPQGQLLVGEDALGRADLTPAVRFKRLMGTRERVRGADGVERSPEELSAEVLKELKAAVRLRFDVELEHAVITVPAMFMQPQCEATNRAADLAGLKAASLLQEPIAAASAYLNEDPEEGDYLVYDLGGGTFDASVVRLRDSQMTVLAHGGDNFLGGADFDRDLLDWVLRQLSGQHGTLPQLDGPVASYRLLHACEAARKRLSTQPETYIDLGDLHLPVAQVPINQSQLEALISPHVTRTLRLARERLDQAAVRPQDLRRVLLVGGPTVTPYIRRRLREEFGADLATDLDPMTVVAVGAAVHAGGLLVRERAAASRDAASGEVVLELYYDPVTSDEFATIAGRVVAPEGFCGEIRIRSAAGDRDTGWIPLRGGAFSTEVGIEASCTSEFRLELRDTLGRQVKTTPSAISIRHGVVPASPVTPYKYGVELQDDKVGWVLQEVVALPAVSEVVAFAASRSVAARSTDMLQVNFVEGRSEVASDNVKVGEIKIRGEELSRTLREGERIEIRIRMNESRLCKARVSIPLLDKDYEVELESIIECPPVDQLNASLAEAAELVADLEPAIPADDHRLVIEARSELEQLEAEMERVQHAEPGGAQRVASKLAHLRGRVRELLHRHRVRVAYLQARQAIADAERIAVKFDDRLGAASMEELRAEADRLSRLDDETRLRAVRERADELFWRHYFTTRDYWVNLVNYLREKRPQACDRIRYHDCLERAEECLQREDLKGVHLHARDAFTYLPDSIRRRAGMMEAGLRRL